MKQKVLNMYVSKLKSLNNTSTRGHDGICLFYSSYFGWRYFSCRKG